MTCHVAVANVNAAVVLADSQASSPDREYHGNQKLFAGDGFVIGGAGVGPVVADVFAHLDRAASLGPKDVEREVERHLEDCVRPGVLPHVELICARDTVSGPQISHYTPELFKAFSSQGPFTSIGSGSDFVWSAVMRDTDLGIVLPKNSLADLFVLAETYAQVADQSLTVDNELLGGVVKDGRSYLLPGPGIVLQFGPRELLQNVGDAAARWAEIRAALTALRSEFRVAQTRFSVIRSRAFTRLDVFQLEQGSQGIEASRAALETKIAAYLVWYDRLLGR